MHIPVTDVSCHRCVQAPLHAAHFQPTRPLNARSQARKCSGHPGGLAVFGQRRARWGSEEVRPGEMLRIVCMNCTLGTGLGVGTLAPAPYLRCVAAWLGVKGCVQGHASPVLGSGTWALVLGLGLVFSPRSFRSVLVRCGCDGRSSSGCSPPRTQDRFGGSSDSGSV